MGIRDTLSNVGSSISRASKKNIGTSGYSQTYFPSIQRKTVAVPVPAQETAARAETKTAGTERKAAKSEQGAAEEERRAAKAEESFLKKLLSKKMGGGDENTETTSASSGSGLLSLVLIILGIAEYLLRISNAELSGLVFFLSLTLFVLSGFALVNFAKKDKLTILVPMLAFVLWYFWFNGNYSPSFLIYFLSIYAGLFFIPVFMTKGESMAAQLLGFVPAIFFFLDIGLIPFLVETLKLPVTPLLQNLILFMPGWALLGIFTIPKDASKSTSVNALLGFLRIMGILYIVFIIVAPAIPGLGVEKSLLPEAGDFEAAQQRLRAGIPQRENPGWTTLICTFTEPQNRECFEQRQELSELTYICEKIEQKEQGTPQFTQCLEEQKKKKKDTALQVQGVIDPTIKEPTKAEIIANKDSFPTEFKPAFGFPFELKVENPREQQITAEVACRFESKGGEKKTVAGKIGGVNPATFNDASFQTSYLCYAAEGEELNGRYEIIFEATLKNLMTGSKLQRAFVGNVPADQIDQWRREEISKVIKNSESLAPAEFARINFNVGHGKKQIVIENDPQKSILVDGNIENVGPGKIVAVKNYQISLEEFSVDNEPCRQGSLEVPNKTIANIALPHCLITDYPEELKNPPRGWEPHTFIATLTYDYQISKKENIEIKPLTS